jgi:hypothetical protein
MSKAFDIKDNELIYYTLSLQKINDVALPIAVQNTLNAMTRDVKTKTLMQSVNKEFDVKKPNFFKANSGYTREKAKDSGYNINKMKSEVGITKGKQANEKATEQLPHQQTGKDIDRSINPLTGLTTNVAEFENGKFDTSSSKRMPKTLPKSLVDVLSKKPEIYDSSGFEFSKYVRKVGRAKRRGAAFISKAGGRGGVYRVKSMKRFKSGKKKGRINFKMDNIASYERGGKVKLRKLHPFLGNAAIATANKELFREFKKQAQYQIDRAFKR